jgi:NAD(P)-dependent dehydrogenase (short-subunit alcohol dehydrogenase family)
VITGGGTGIGRATALVFGREGARVVVANRRREEGEAVAAAIRDAGGEAIFVQTDVTRREDNERMIDLALERWGSLDILYCNAGVVVAKLVEDTSDEDLALMLDTNVKALVYAARHAVPIMKRQGSGVILINASKTGLVAQRDSPVYCATKGAAVQFAKALALDYATDNIRVNAICPGIIDTPLLNDFIQQREDPAASRAFHEAAQPMGRLGTPEECAYAAVFLASNEASFITGVPLPIDGGFVAG